MKRIGLLISIMLFLAGCPSKKQPAVPETKKSQQTLRDLGEVKLKLPSEKLKQSTSDVSLQILMQGLSDFDAIYKELVRIALDQKDTQVSLFYKLQRAIAGEDGIKVSPMSLLGCERYQVKYFPQKTNWQNLEVSEVCLKDPARLFEVQKKNQSQFQLTIFSEPLQRLLGLKATLAFQRAECDLKVLDGRLSFLKCEKLAQEKPQTDWVLLIQNLTVEQSKGIFQASLAGQMLENLAPLRKFEMTVPAQGPVQIKETELFPAEEIQQPVAPPVVPVTPPASINAGQPLEIKNESYQKWISGDPAPENEMNPVGSDGHAQAEAEGEEINQETETNEAEVTQEDGSEENSAQADGAEVPAEEEGESEAQEDAQVQEEVANQPGGIIGQPEIQAPPEAERNGR